MLMRNTKRLPLYKDHELITDTGKWKNNGVVEQLRVGGEEEGKEGCN